MITSLSFADERTPSDDGAWSTLFDHDTDEAHVVPDFGPKHQLSCKCWCHPVLDTRYTEPAVSHNVAQ